MKNNKLLLLAGLSLVILTACSSKSKTGIIPGAEPTNGIERTELEKIESETSDEMGDTIVFNLTGKNFKFVMDGTESPDLRVKKDSRVRINFTSTDGLHDWVLDDFGAATEKIETDESTFVEFIANETGTFEYYCSVGEHRTNGMRGNLIIE